MRPRRATTSIAGPQGRPSRLAIVEGWRCSAPVRPRSIDAPVWHDAAGPDGKEGTSDDLMSWQPPRD
jgi:hypothetical protein